MKKLARMILPIVLAVTLLAGCGTSSGPDLAASTPKPAATTAAQQTVAITAATPAAPEPVTYDYAKLTWYWYQSGRKFPADIYPLQKMKEEINVELVPINPEGTDFESMLLTLISSGDAPDLISTYTELTNKLIAENIIIPVQDYLTEEYVPNLIRVSNEWDRALSTLRYADGNIWVVPDVKQHLLPDQLDWVRKDWLDKVGLDVPTTYDEVYAMLKAFVGQDLNGDGGKTEPMMSNMFWGLAYMFEAYGATNEWYIGEDGLYEVGMFTPRAKEVLKQIKDLVDSKALSPDFQTIQYNEIGEKIRNGLVGYHHGWSSFDDGDKMKETYPDAEWVPFVSPKGIFDKGYASYKRTQDFTVERYAVSASTKDLDAVWRMIDWLCVDTATSTDPGNMTFEGSYWYQRGERGVNWEAVNGKYVAGGTFPDDQALADKFQKQNEIDVWADWAFVRFHNKFETIWMGSTPNRLAQMEHTRSLPTGDDIPADSPYLPRACLTPLEDPAYEVFKNTYMDWDNTSKFAEVVGYNVVFGKKDIDAAFDEYLKLVNDNGYQDMRKLVTEHYAKYPFEY